jgi:aromatic ring hydroxylase
MAITTENNKVYASITDLPALDNMRSGDNFIVQTSTGTMLFDFDSLLIPLDNVSFQSQFTEMWESYSTYGESFETIGTATINVSDLDSSTATLADAVNQLNTNDVTNYNEIREKVNNLLAIINANSSILTIPDDVSLPISLLSLKS